MTKSLDSFIDDLLEKKSIQLFSIFNNNEFTDEEEEEFASFITYMLTRCVLIIDPHCDAVNCFKFSSFGRTRLEGNSTREVFIDSFRNYA